MDPLLCENPEIVMDGTVLFGVKSWFIVFILTAGWALVFYANFVSPKFQAKDKAKRPRLIVFLFGLLIMGLSYLSWQDYRDTRRNYQAGKYTAIIGDITEIRPSVTFYNFEIVSAVIFKISGVIIRKDGSVVKTSGGANTLGYNSNASIYGNAGKICMGKSCNGLKVGDRIRLLKMTYPNDTIRIEKCLG